MRKLLLAGLAACTVLAGVVPARGADATGTYLTPFREDHATYTADGGFTGGQYAGHSTDANGCVTEGNVAGAPADNPDAYNCLPTGATVAVLGDGSIPDGEA